MNVVLPFFQASFAVEKLGCICELLGLQSGKGDDEMTLRKKLGLSILGLLAVIMVGLAVWEPLTASRQVAPVFRKYDVQISRDEFGVPHINGKTDADAAYGLAFAHGEDDFSTLQEVVAMTRGRTGALLGSDGAPVDFVENLLGVRETVDAKYETIPIDVRAVIEAYASGLNYYAVKHPEEIRLPKLFPVSGKDVAAGFVLRSPFFYGLDNSIKSLVEGEEPNSEPVADVSGGGKQTFLTPIGRDPSMNGSNAFAISPKRMADGKTWLISNSHQPYEGQVAWYEAVVHSGEGLDMAGALFPGSPFVLLGHNRNLGWTNTVNQPDLVDVYKLSLNDAGTSYKYDGKWLPLEQHRIWLPVKFGPFALPIPKTVYRSVHGPVIINKNGAFAIRYAGMGSVKLLEQYFRIQKAKDYAEWIAAMRLRGISATNFIYADKTGRIGYFYNALFPARKAGFDYTKTLPGDSSADVWSSDPLPWETTPMVVNPASGFVTNANNTPFMAAGAGSELDPHKFSILLGIEARKTNRIIRAIELLSADESITPEELLAIKFDTAYSKNSFAGVWVGKLLAIDTSKEPDLAAAQKLLSQWDYNSDGIGRADSVGEAMMHMANSANYHGKPLPDAHAKLREVVDSLMKGFGRIDPPLGEVQRLIRGKVNIAASGGTDTLRAATIWEPQPDGKMRVRHGDSFVMLVNWDKSGKVASQSIQPYGAATNKPDSPHYTDQMKLFEAQQFKQVHFEWADALAHSKRIYRP
jgi:acyl-homoserine-lactone acylase